MEKSIIFTNWKMNKTGAESEDFIKRLVGLYGSRRDIDLIMCVPYLYIGFLSPICRDSCIAIGSENLYIGDWGSFTGEISAPMLASVGCAYALIGHSERRRYFHENDELVNAKLISALEHGLFPIVCIGETREERDENRTFDILKRQVEVCFKGVTEDHSLHIAYEPRWAIGTGMTPEFGEIEKIHLFIKDELGNRFGPEISKNIRLLYGGSVYPENTFSICRLRGVDGVGFGGCSLDMDCLARGINESIRALHR
jgi:triosephosphate isomerase